MKISIAMATYNGAKFLREQLDSFSAQTRLPDELVVCDDGSSDATPEILDAFAASAPFAVRVVRNEKNLGYRRNFEKAMSLCTGDIVFLSDQDDIWLPKKLQIVEAEFEKNPRVMSTINDMIITDAEMNDSGATQLGNILRAGHTDRMFGPGCCSAIRKEMLKLLFPFPSDDYSHDAWVMETTRGLGVRKIIFEPLQLYRRHGANESQSFLSNPKKVTIFTLISHLDLKSPLDAWEIHYHLNDIKRGWLLERRADIEALGFGDRIDYFLKNMEKDENDIRRRIEFLKTPRYRRFPAVLSFWMHGRYRRFAGWKSAVKDMIRP